MNETANETQARLLEVIDFQVWPGPYAFAPVAAGAPKLRDDALACVRDGAGWSELVPADEPTPPMASRIFAFLSNAWRWR